MKWRVQNENHKRMVYVSDETKSGLSKEIFYSEMLIQGQKNGNHWPSMSVPNLHIQPTTDQNSSKLENSVCTEHVHFSLSLFHKQYNITTTYIAFTLY
jgi:hypothetical protein